MMAIADFIAEYASLAIARLRSLMDTSCVMSSMRNVDTSWYFTSTRCSSSILASRSW